MKRQVFDNIFLRIIAPQGIHVYKDKDKTSEVCLRNTVYVVKNKTKKMKLKHIVKTSK